MPPDKRSGPREGRSNVEVATSTDTASVMALLDRITDPTFNLLNEAGDSLGWASSLLTEILGDKETLDRLGVKHGHKLDEAWDAIYDAEQFLDKLRAHLGGGR
jgi:hypothetical protein